MKKEPVGPGEASLAVERAYQAEVDCLGIDVVTAQPAPNDPIHPDWVAGGPPGILPTDPKVRKNAPMARGCLDYFPRALLAVADLSRVGNDQHNPGQPLHWAKDKSTDHADCILRHLIDRGTLDTDGVRHSAKVAWRALALLEIELEAYAKLVGRLP